MTRNETDNLSGPDGRHAGRASTRRKPYARQAGTNLLKRICPSPTTLDRVKELIGAGARVNEECSIPAGKDFKGIDRPLIIASPLHLVSYRHYDFPAKAGKILLEAGANLNGKDLDGYSPLHYAAMNERVGLLKVLLDSGARVNAKDDKGATPLHLAAYFYSGDFTTIKALLDAGARINANSYRGETPLDWHAESEGPDISEGLIDAGFKYGDR